MLKLVRREGRTNWYIRGAVRGIAVFESTGTPDKAAAEAIRTQREADILQRSVFGPKATATFLEAAAAYLDAGGDKRFIGRLVEHFGTRPLAAIDQAAMNAAARALYGGRAAATVVRQLYVPMTAILNLGADMGLCDPPRFKRPKVQRKPIRVPPDEWWDQVLPCCSPKLAALLIFMSTTGARVSEVIRLEWADVDMRRREAVVHRTKTGKPRLVTLVPAALAALSRLPRDHLRVFGYTARGSVTGALKAACKRAGVEYYGTHACGRHTLARSILRAGGSLKHVQQAGGWASIRLVAETYAHLEADDVQRVVARAAKLRRIK